MKKDYFKVKKIFLIYALLTVLVFGLSACGESKRQIETTINTKNINEDENNIMEHSNIETEELSNAISELEVKFGDEGASFILHLYDNDTANGIARSIGTNNWRLPIYHYDDFENSDVMQYYDIPSTYEIPYEPEIITSEKAGEVYYSEPNRIILFYKDAEVSGEYAKVGYFDYSDEFLLAVENNPVLEGWGNKIILINSTQ